jgi:uncharacterized delta-60 repeat protein
MNAQIASRRIITVLVVLLGLGAGLLVSNKRATAQGQVQVTAADPASGAQGTINLNVKVTGKGFKNGAKAKWFLTGTTDTGGVTVNSTTFVSSTELNANITVSDTAVIGNFDIQVLNSDGRGGKGTELFAVTAKGGGQTVCPAPAPAPTGDTKCYSTSPGCLDLTFGGIGFVHTDINQSSNAANAVVVQSDGKIVVAGGASTSSTSQDFAVIRYNVDGSLDTSFGDPDPVNPPLRRGYTVTVITTGSDTANAMVLQPDGKIVVVGWANGVDTAAIVRYNVNGTLDAGFGSGGVVLLNFGKRLGAPARDVALQTDGKILIGGSALASDGSATGGFALARLLPNGSVDSGFGSSGMVVANPSGARGASAVGWSIAIQRVPAITGEERIVIGGNSSTSSSANSDWTLMRFKPNGATDTSFGTSGIVKTAFFGFGDTIHRVGIDSSNRIVGAGLTRIASSNCGGYVIDYAVARYAQDGSLDGSFAGGKQTVDIYGGMDQLYGLAIQADNKIVAAGYAFSSDSTVKTFALVRFNVDGSRDASFGLLGNGVVTTNLYGFENYAVAVALQPADGKIVVAGSANFAAGGPWDIVVARYQP